MLNGITNFLRIINENWTSIVIIISLVVAITRRVQVFFAQADADRISAAKAQIKEIMLKLITDAEMDFEDWNKAGSIKRAQVIEQIYKQYPILSKVANQQGLIRWLDGVINASLNELHEIVEQNNTEAE